MDVDKVYEEYINGKSSNQLAKEYGVNNKTIRARLLRSGFNLKTPSQFHRKYKIKENFFDKIDTEEKAYFLGFLYADGYNNVSKGAVDLSLIESDKDILERLKQLIQPDKPLQFLNKSKERERGKKSSDGYRLAISSRHISNQLEALGCGQNKTYILKFPTENQIPKHLIRHFVRGYFDGDGGICLYTVNQSQNKISLSITSTLEFIEELQLLLNKELNFKILKLVTRYPERNNNIRSLMFSGRIKCSTFGDWLYKDATIFLDRKRQKFNKLKLYPYTVTCM